MTNDERLIRSTHPYAYRSGEWATLAGVVDHAIGHRCYLVRFADGTSDFWVVDDAAAGYEFTDAALDQQADPMTFCVGPHKPPADGEDWQPPLATTGYLCQRCRARLSSLLVEFPAIAAWLNVNISPGSGSSLDSQISGSRELPIPLRQDVLDLIGPTARRREAAMLANLDDQLGDLSIHDVVTYWAKLVHEEAGTDWPDRNDVVTLTGWLHRQLDWIVKQPWVDEMIAELSDTQRKARNIAPWDAEQRRITSDCPSCDMRALVFHRGDGVWCEQQLGGCGRHWIDDDYDRLILVLGSAALERIA